MGPGTLLSFGEAVCFHLPLALGLSCRHPHQSVFRVASRGALPQSLLAPTFQHSGPRPGHFQLKLPGGEC